MKRTLTVVVLLVTVSFIFSTQRHGYAQKQNPPFSPVIPKTWVDAEPDAPAPGH